VDEQLLAAIVEARDGLHELGTLAPAVLKAIAGHLGSSRVRHSIETGSGASTLLFSHLSEEHKVFAMDTVSSSISAVRASHLFRAATTTFIEGPTQTTLPAHVFEDTLQAALIDGPHAFPFPALEYYYIYPHLEPGALLIVDDIQIPTIHDLFRFLKRDAMFELIEVVGSAAFFRRTSAPSFDPLGDGWWLQGYNRSPRWRYSWKGRAGNAIAPLFRSGAAAFTRAVFGRQCQVEITSPEPAAETGAEGMVIGRANIPAGTHLWLLARRKDVAGWWPQGGAAAEIRHGEWSLPVRYGEPSDAGKEFEIAAVVVDEHTHHRLAQWVEQGKRTGHHSPIAFPKTVAVSAPAKRTVRKVRH